MSPPQGWTRAPSGSCGTSSRSRLSTRVSDPLLHSSYSQQLAFSGSETRGLTFKREGNSLRTPQAEPEIDVHQGLGTKFVPSSDLESPGETVACVSIVECPDCQHKKAANGQREGLVLQPWRAASSAQLPSPEQWLIWVQAKPGSFVLFLLLLFCRVFGARRAHSAADIAQHGGVRGALQPHRHPRGRPPALPRSGAAPEEPLRRRLPPHHAPGQATLGDGHHWGGEPPAAAAGCCRGGVGAARGACRAAAAVRPDARHPVLQHRPAGWAAAAPSVILNRLLFCGDASLQ